MADARAPAGNPRRIVVRAPNWLGDLMVATGVLRAILERWPEAVVDLVVRAGHEALPLPRRGRAIPFDRAGTSAGALGASLAASGYDRFYVLPPSFSAAWMAWRSRAPARIGYRGQLRGLLLRPALAHRAPPRSVHLAREYLDLLDPALELDCYPPRLDVPDAWVGGRLAGACRSLPERFVALAPGAVYGPAKAWPAPRYRELARGLRDRAGCPVVIVGTASEHALGETVRAGEGGVLNWCGATDLPGLVAVLARAALLVSNDSGAMHVAAALRRPQVALFGPTSPAWTAPLNPRAAVLSLGLPCAPCFARTCRWGHGDCLGKIAVDAVLAAALALLGKNPVSPTAGR
ncbi:MAG TPA: lipopolysaccharide heptosyltransferase II [Candidatus Methanoperedens sp.]|nr:lipopolysaccharide heptosyltransferase II [Candidatus Methanoperedens sp.]